MMEDLKEAARLLDCPIQNDGRDTVIGGHIAVITAEGIRTVHGSYGARQPSDGMLIMAAEPRMAAIAYRRLKMPAWIYFKEKRLKELTLPPKPFASYIILVTRFDDEDGFVRANIQADKWSYKGREVSVLRAKTEKDFDDLLIGFSAYV